MKKNAALEREKKPKTPKRLKENSAKSQKSAGRANAGRAKSAGKAETKAAVTSAKVGERVAETGGHLQDRLHEVADAAANGAVQRADRYVQLASDRVREIEQTGHEAASKLSPHQPEVLTHAIDYFADHLGGVADYFEQRDARDILEDTRRLVRDHPVPMLGACALLGIATGRFLLAGSDNVEE